MGSIGCVSIRQVLNDVLTSVETSWTRCYPQSLFLINPWWTLLPLNFWRLFGTCVYFQYEKYFPVVSANLYYVLCDKYFCLIQARLWFHNMTYESKCFFPLQLFLNFLWFYVCHWYPQLSVFHAFSRYVCSLATNGNCFPPLIIILCQYLFWFCLNWGSGVV